MERRQRRKKRARRKPPCGPGHQTPRSQSSPARIIFCAFGVGWLHFSCCDEKSLKLHRRSLEMKLCFSMTHTYTSSSSICRASVNPAPSSLPNPSNSHVLLLLRTGGCRLQRPGCHHFAHVSVIEGRNLARLDHSPAWVQLLARPVHTHTSTHTWRTGHSVLFFLPLLCLKKCRDCLCSTPLGPGHVRARAEPPPLPSSPCRHACYARV